MSWILGTWPEWLALLLGFLLAKVRVHQAKPKPASPPAPTWTPEVGPSRTDQWDFAGARAAEGTVSVRLRKGDKTLPLGSVSITDAEFESKINKLTRDAEERAAALNAAEMETSAA